MIKLAIVEDKVSIRNSLIEKLNEMEGLQVVLEAGDGEAFLEKIEAMDPLARPDLTLMDLDMPRLGGVETITIAAPRYPDTLFLVLTVFDEEEKIFEAIQAGAIGYLLKDESPLTISHAIQSAVTFGGAPMSPRIARKALQLLSKQTPAAASPAEKPAALSERETEILKGLVEGSNYKTIADQMFISPHTVRKHIANIYNKLHVSNRAQAVGLALRKQWYQ